MKKLLTAEEVKARFEREGRTFTEWANEHGFKPYAVHRVLSGTVKCRRGESHNIAVALGLKDGVIREDRRHA